MAETGAGYGATYNVIGNREDLTDVLTNIDPTATPFFSSIGRTVATSTLHEWQTDTLPAAVISNANQEGASAAIASASVTTRLTNRTQILDQVVSVTNTQLDGMRTAGRENEWAYQMKRLSIALARDIEKSLLQNSAALTHSSTVAGKFEGLGLHDDGSSVEASASAAGWLSANLFIGTACGQLGGTTAGIVGSGRTKLTETMFNDLLQVIWENDGHPNMIITHNFNKRVISAFTANATRYASVDFGDKRLNGSVSIYESDFGMIQIRLDHFTSKTAIGAVETQYFKVATLRPLTFSRLAKDGDREKGQFVTEITLAAYAPKSGGMIRGLSSAEGVTASYATSDIRLKTNIRKI